MIIRMDNKTEIQKSYDEFDEILENWINNKFLNYSVPSIVPDC
jgi:hypothetical protein